MNLRDRFGPSKHLKKTLHMPSFLVYAHTFSRRSARVSCSWKLCKLLLTCGLLSYHSTEKLQQ